MTMYADLVNSLRCCADDDLTCGRCKYCDMYMDSCTSTLMDEAANAIEGLLEISKRYYDLLEKKEKT